MQLWYVHASTQPNTATRKTIAQEDLLMQSPPCISTRYNTTLACTRPRLNPHAHTRNAAESHFCVLCLSARPAAQFYSLGSTALSAVPEGAAAAPGVALGTCRTSRSSGGPAGERSLGVAGGDGVSIVAAREESMPPSPLAAALAMALAPAATSAACSLAALAVALAEGKNSAIFRKEKFLKAQLKGDTLSGRGTERVITNLRKLFNLIKQTSNKTDEDIEIERRKSDLLAQRNITSDDQVMKVSAHETPKTGKGKTIFRTHWSRPSIVTEYVKDKDGKNKRDADGKLMKKTKKIYTTDETYNKLINFRDGKEKADEYMKKHPRAKFNL